MKCQEARAELVAYLDNELKPSARAEVESHLEACETCRAERDALAATLQRIGEIPRPEPGADFKRRFWKDFDQRNQCARRRWFRRPLTLAGAGLAAGVLVLVLLLWPGGQPTLPREEVIIASHLDLFSDYQAIRHLEMLEDFEYIQAWDDEG